MTKRGREVLPKSFMDRVTHGPDGRRRASKKVEWFLQYLEHGDGPRAVLDAGYDTKWPSTMAYRLTQEFRELLLEAFFIKNSMDQMLAAQVQHSILTMSASQPVLDSDGQRVFDDEGRPVLEVDKKLLAIQQKAAQMTLSQGPLPPGLALRGLPVGHVDPHRETDFRRVLDGLVQEYGGGTEGAIRLLAAPGVGSFKQYRDYLVDRYQVPRLVNALPEPAAMEAQVERADSAD